MLAVSTVPLDVACITIKVTGASAVQRSFDVKGGQAATLVLGGLPTGDVVFTADAYAVGCAAIALATPTWIGDPVSIVLLRGPNGTITIKMRPNGTVVVTVDFGDPSPPGVCQPASTTCTSDRDCCSKACGGPDPITGNLARLCLATQPPAPSAGPFAIDPEKLRPKRGHAVLPAYDGDLLFVTFPPAIVATTPSTDVILHDFVLPSLLAAGVKNTDRVLKFPPLRRELKGGSFEALLGGACNTAGATQNRLLATYCSVLQRTPSENPVLSDMQRGLAISVPGLKRQISRGMQYWIYQQRHDDGVPIEHHGVIASRFPGQQISNVFGAVVSNYQITNQHPLPFDEALRRGQLALNRLEAVTTSDHLAPVPQPALVLLPYGGFAGDMSGATTALRYAYRGLLGGARAGQEGPVLLSYTVWVDAQTGDLLKLIKDTQEITPTPALFSSRRFFRDPSTLLGTSGAALEITSPIVAADDGANVTLVNDEFGNALVGSVAVSFPSSGFAALAENSPAIVGLGACDQQARRALNAFTALSDIRVDLVGAGSLAGLSKISPKVDIFGTDSTADTTRDVLSFGRGNVAAVTASMCATSTLATPRRPGALDVTVLAHEMAHLTTASLERDFLTCDPGLDCAVSDPDVRQRFHDFADGYGALLTRTPCIGGWSASQDPKAATCSGHSPSTVLPRLLLVDALPEFPLAAMKVSDLDVFPDPAHGGDYGRGQYLGAALWHTRQGMYSLAGPAGPMSLLTWLNQGVAKTGFSNKICVGCDADTYRGARELLVHLANLWAYSEEEGARTTNKLLSGFARAGLFLVPHSCMDGKPNPMGPSVEGDYCPGEDWAGDAIVDITDNEADDTGSEGVTFLEDDHVNRCTKKPPSFRIWTGPAFKFDPTTGMAAPVAALPVSSPGVSVRDAGAPDAGAPDAGVGDAGMGGPDAGAPDASKADTGAADAGGSGAPALLCNNHYTLEFSTDGVTWGLVSESGDLQPVDRCYRMHNLSAGDWQAILDTGSSTIYYRVRTSQVDSAGSASHERASDQPGAGLWSATTPVGGFASRFFLNATGAAGDVSTACP